MLDNLGDLWASLRDLVRRVRRLETAAPLQNAAITRGSLRVASNEGLIVEGSAKVSGWLVVTGTGRVVGRLEGTGQFDWSGAWAISGNGGISGDLALSGDLNATGASTIGGSLNVTGPTTLNGDVTLNSDLSLGASAQITAGTVKINRFGSYGGQIVSTGTILYLGAGETVIVGAEYLSTNKIAATDIEGFTLDIIGAKSFKMPHPTKPNHWLRHGSTESPVSGVEYWGEETIGVDGSVRVELPEYFEALAKPDGRTVFITGRGHLPDWSDIEDGSFTVTGTPGGRFSWLVKAERFGGDFLLEEQISPEPEE